MDLDEQSQLSQNTGTSNFIIPSSQDENEEGESLPGLQLSMNTLQEDTGIEDDGDSDNEQALDDRSPVIEPLYQPALIDTLQASDTEKDGDINRDDEYRIADTSADTCSDVEIPPSVEPVRTVLEETPSESENADVTVISVKLGTTRETISSDDADVTIIRTEQPVAQLADDTGWLSTGKARPKTAPLFESSEMLQDVSSSSRKIVKLSENSSIHLELSETQNEHSMLQPQDVCDVSHNDQDDDDNKPEDDFGTSQDFVLRYSPSQSTASHDSQHQKHSSSNDKQPSSRGSSSSAGFHLSLPKTVPQSATAGSQSLQVVKLPWQSAVEMLEKQAVNKDPSLATISKKHVVSPVIYTPADPVLRAEDDEDGEPMQELSFNITRPDVHAFDTAGSEEMRNGSIFRRAAEAAKQHSPRARVAFFESEEDPFMFLSALQTRVPSPHVSDMDTQITREGDKSVFITSTEADKTLEPENRMKGERGTLKISLQTKDREKADPKLGPCELAIVNVAGEHPIGTEVICDAGSMHTDVASGKHTDVASGKHTDVESGKHTDVASGKQIDESLPDYDMQSVEIIKDSDYKSDSSNDGIFSTVSFSEDTQLCSAEENIPNNTKKQTAISENQSDKPPDLHPTDSNSVPQLAASTLETDEVVPVASTSRHDPYAFHGTQSQEHRDGIKDPNKLGVKTPQTPAQKQQAKKLQKHLMSPASKSHYQKSDQNKPDNPEAGWSTRSTPVVRPRSLHAGRGDMNIPDIEIRGDGQSRPVSLAHSDATADTQRIASQFDASPPLIAKRTIITETTYRYTKRVITVEYSQGGKLINETISEETEEPVLIEKSSHETIRYLPAEMSPSRSTSTVTSGDLGDVSSLSKSGSHSSKTSSSISLEPLHSTSSLDTVPSYLSSFAAKATQPIVTSRSLRRVLSGQSPVLVETSEESDHAMHRSLVAGHGANDRLTAGADNVTVIGPGNMSVQSAQVHPDVSHHTSSESLFTSPDVSRNVSSIHRPDSRNDFSVVQCDASSRVSPWVTGQPRPSGVGNTVRSCKQAADSTASTPENGIASKHDALRDDNFSERQVTGEFVPQLPASSSSGVAREPGLTPKTGKKFRNTSATSRRRGKGKAFVKRLSGKQPLSKSYVTRRKMTKVIQQPANSVTEIELERDEASKDVQPKRKGRTAKLTPSLVTRRRQRTADHDPPDVNVLPAKRGRVPSKDDSKSGKSSSSRATEDFSPVISLQADVMHMPVRTDVTSSQLQIGALVMAKWKDGFFYPAKIMQHKGDDNYLSANLANIFETPQTNIKPSSEKIALLQLLKNALKMSYITCMFGTPLASHHQRSEKSAPIEPELLKNTYTVFFLDGDLLPIKLSDLIMIERLNIGQSVLVQSGDGGFDPGLIIGYEGHGENLEYQVEKDDAVCQRYTLDKVILSADQAACMLGYEPTSVVLLGSPAISRADVSLDNLVDGKRRVKRHDVITTPKTRKTNVKQTALLDTGNASSPSKSYQKHKRAEAAEPDQTLAGASGTLSGRKRKIGGFEPNSTSTPTPHGKRRFVSPAKTRPSSPACRLGIVDSPQTTRHASRKVRTELFDEYKGPLPSEPGIFCDMLFMLTYVEKTYEQKQRERRLLQASPPIELSTDESSAAVAGQQEDSVPFDKEHLQNQIEAGGGIFLDKFDEAKILSARNGCYLISDSYQRTIKYLLCLASGIPCVSHVWIRDSCRQGSLLAHKKYILPAGISLQDKKIIECGTQRSHNSPLLNMHIAVVSSNKDFRSTWVDILKLANSYVTTSAPAHFGTGEERFDVLVTDTCCPKSVLKKARQDEISVVSPEWVIQSLITWQRVSTSGHLRYQHDYQES